MAKRLLALCDSDKSYVNRFLSYMKNRGNLPFQTAGFTSLEALRRYLEKNKIDILLFSPMTEVFLNKDSYGTGRDCLKNVKVPEQLAENENIADVVIFDEVNDLYSRQKCLNKFRSAEEIISDIISIVLDDTDRYESLGTDLNILGIYYPLYSISKHIFPLFLAELISSDASVLYIDLKRFSAIKEYISRSGSFENKKDISDLIYFFRTGSKRFGEVLQGSIYKYGGIDILFAPYDMEDMELLKEDEWGEFLSEIKKFGNYEYLILDMHEAFRKIETVFNICQNILVLTAETQIEQKCFMNIKDYYIKKEGEKNSARLSEVKLEDISLNGKEDIGKLLDIEQVACIRTKAEEIYFSGLTDGYYENRY